MRRFRPSVVLCLCVGLAFAGLAGCTKKKPAPSAPAATLSPADPAAFTLADPVVTLSFAFPDTGPEFAQVRDSLAGQARQAFTQYKSECAEAKASAAADKLEFQPCTVEFAWRRTAAGAGLVAYEGAASTFTGGAHPNTDRMGVIWDLGAGRRLGFADMFAAPNAVATVKEELCAALRAEKATRIKNAGLGEAVPFDCPDPTDLAMTLVPATEPDHFAGLTFLLGPYDIGVYAEGPYDGFVPAALLAPLANPRFAPLFAGAPAPGAVPPADGLPTPIVKAGAGRTP